MIPIKQSGSLPPANHLSRALRRQNAFCKLPDAVALAIDAVADTRAYAEGAVLFFEERPPQGVFILCSGRVRLSITGTNGKSHVLRIADQPGEFLGATAVICRTPHPFTAQAVEVAQLSFIEANDFLRLLHTYPELAVWIVTQLSDVYDTACQHMRSLQYSVPEKLAACLLEWSDKESGTCIRLLTHEAISQMIGTSRETVTRLLAEWNSNGWIRGRRSKLTIRNRAALEQRAKLCNAVTVMRVSGPRSRARLAHKK